MIKNTSISCLALILAAAAVIKASNNYTQKVSIWKFDDWQSAVKKNNDTVYVVNFWATWCGPCVKEMPEFVRLHQAMEGKKVKILLVSLDFKKDLKKVQAFADKNQIEPTVVLLDEPDYNRWLEKAEPTWQGAIPATVFIKNGVNKAFINRQTDFETLLNTVQKLL